MNPATPHGPTTHREPQSSHGPLLPLLILVALSLFVPFTLLAFITFMASSAAR